jgi:DNA-directed RNA polymerase subunit omega
VKAELVKLALEQVGDPNLLVNIISRRVRQLTSVGGMGSRPLILETGTMGLADIAMTELIEHKYTYALPEGEPVNEDPSLRRRRRPA